MMRSFIISLYDFTYQDPLQLKNFLYFSFPCAKDFLYCSPIPLIKVYKDKKIADDSRRRKPHDIPLQNNFPRLKVGIECLGFSTLICDLVGQPLNSNCKIIKLAFTLASTTTFSFTSTHFSHN